VASFAALTKTNCKQ